MSVCGARYHSLAKPSQHAPRHQRHQGWGPYWVADQKVEVPCIGAVATNATKCIKYIKKQLYLIEKSCYFVWIRETFISDQVMLQPSVLLVEDDAFQRKAAETYLMNHDLRVIAVENGAQMRRQISRSMPDLVLLDVQLPGQEDGFALARWLRESNTKVGIIMLTAAGDSVDKVLGLESGADDYVAKPYEPRELLARCKSVLRRSVNKSTPSRLERVRMGHHVLDLSRRALHDDGGQDVAVTAGEFDILKTF